MPARTPADVDRLFAEVLSAGDLDRALEMYEQDASYVDGDGKAAHGHEQIRAVLAELLTLESTLDCYEIDVVENGDIAVLRARWTFSGTDQNDEPFKRNGRSIEVVRRQSDGTWRFIIDLPSGAS